MKTARTLSSEPNWPRCVPRPSSLRRWTSASYQISLPLMVDTPLFLRVILWMAFLVTRLPRLLRPLMARVEKSYSIELFFSIGFGRKVTLTLSASPLWFTVIHIIWLPGLPWVISYSLSRVTEVILNRLA